MGKEIGKTNPQTNEEERVSAKEAVEGPKAVHPLKKAGAWKNKKYTKQLVEYVNHSIRDDEKGVYTEFFNALVEKYNLTEPADLMLVDLAVYDFLRIKRLHNILMKEGDMKTCYSKLGNSYQKPNEASYLLNAVESQLRQTMKELMLTKKEQAKKLIGFGMSFDNFLSGTKVIDVEDAEKNDKEEDLE